ncbi:hypothetical protein [Aeromonas dhakensis]|uniref:hypothetical protein n=1 Tax=Aeromonas dhakensis TaxID=196024 RepID=UPI0011190E42|nr:hypothetical protein [Aeromonas dhakensis]TNI47140.1 hypothetical protein CF130_05045 [Aeromonas dhakensis]
MSSIDMSEMGALVSQLARAFVTEWGPYFLSPGSHGAANIALPLTVEDMTATIQNMVVDQAGSVYGPEFSLSVLRNSLDGDALSDTGFSLVCALLEEVCGDIRQMIAEGRDPAVEIARMRSERAARAGA